MVIDNIFFVVNKVFPNIRNRASRLKQNVINVIELYKFIITFHKNKLETNQSNQEP